MNDDFFERVKVLLKTKNITIKDFIESLDMNYDTYNGLRRLKNLPRADEALKIANALNVSIEYLITGNQSDNKEKIDRIVENLTIAIEDIKNLN